MRRTLFLALLLLAAGPPAQERHLDYPELLAWMTDLDRLWQPPAAGEKAFQFSSYDRRSHAGQGRRALGPKQTRGWYANGDRGRYLRVEERAGKKEHVMVDVKGPGTVTRIWSANPKGMLHFYLDGAKEPTWSVDFKKLTDGTTPPFPEPLAGMRARGANCHVPFPFARHLKVTATDGNMYYQVNVRLFPEEWRVPSFSPALLDRHAAALEGTAKILSGPAALPAEGRRVRWQQRLQAAAPPGRVALTDALCHRLEGPLVIRALRLRVEPPAGSKAGKWGLREGLLRRVLLCVEVDGRRTIEVPVGDFFGSAPGFTPYRCYPLGVVQGGGDTGLEEGLWGCCAFPMPARKEIRIRLVSTCTLTGAEWTVDAVYQKQPVPEEALAFHASWHQRKQVRTRPISDYRVLGADGPGRFVGCSLTVANPTSSWWGEGDEKFFVDGEEFPSTFGTGTEDYFGYAWCCPRLFASAYHAQVRCDGPGNFGYTCLNRFQVPDMVPFQKSFLFDLEIWHWRDVHLDYASTAYWYGRPGAASGLPPVAAWPRRRAEPVAKPAPYLVAGAVEGEELKVLAITGGRHRVQELERKAHTGWSRDRHLWWTGGKHGDRLTLEVPVPEAGRYRIRGAFTKAVDYGVIQLHLEGRKLGPPLDLYHDGVVPSGPVTLGEVDLPRGPVRLTLEITGKNKKAVPKYMVGLDYLMLEEISD